MYSVLTEIIAGYASEYELLPWIQLDKIHWRYLSRNPAIFKSNEVSIIDILQNMH